MDSYATECLILPRAGESGLFELQTDGRVIARLCRYAIIPLEEYRRLKEFENDIRRLGITVSKTNDGLRWHVH